MNDQARAAVRGWQHTVDAAHEQQRTALGAAPGQQPEITRPLTKEEADLAHLVFGDSIDTRNIQLSVGGLLGSGGDKAITLPDHITFPTGTSTAPSPRFNSWLVHELTHIWQYQHGHRPLDLVPDAAVGHVDPAHYLYGGPQALVDATNQGKTFTQFNHEQQATILADYYLLLAEEKDTSAYDPFVASVRDEAPNPWWVEVLTNLGPSAPPGS